MFEEENKKDSFPGRISPFLAIHFMLLTFPTIFFSDLKL